MSPSRVIGLGALLVGAVLFPIAVGVLAGPWWGALIGSVALAGLGVALLHEPRTGRYAAISRGESNRGRQ